MTVASTTSKSGPYNGNGSTSNFAVLFKYTDKADVDVIVTSSAGVETTKTLNTHYTLTDPGDTGTVSFITSPTDYRPQTGETVTIVRTTPMTQSTDYTTGGGFSSATVEATDDRQLMQIQEIAERVSRAPKLRQTTGSTTPTFPEPLADHLIAWNSAGTDLENKVPADLDIGLVSPFIQTLLDDTTAAAARTTLGVAIGTDVQAWDAQLDSLSSASANGVSLVTSANYAAMRGLLDLEAGTDFYSIAAADAAFLSPAEGNAVYLAISAARVRLTADANYYVATTGSDITGTGAIGAPWQTLQFANNYIAKNIDLAGFDVTINLADGTYTAGLIVHMPLVSSADFVTDSQHYRIIGNNVTPANVIVQDPAGDAIATWATGTRVWLESFTVESATASGLAAYDGAYLAFKNMRFGVCDEAHIKTDRGGIIINESGAGYTIAGNAENHFEASSGSRIQIRSGNTVTLTGTPAFTTFANIRSNSTLVTTGVTYTGAATGVRFAVASGGAIITGTDDFNFLPGDADGTFASGGIYDSAVSSGDFVGDMDHEGSIIARAALRLTNDITPSQITSNTNNYNPTGLSTAFGLRLATDATRTLTGLTAGAAGRILTIYNIGSFDIVLASESASSTDVNRFALPSSIALHPNDSIQLRYDATSQRWRQSSPSARGMVLITSGSFPAAATLSITNIPATFSALIFQISGVSSDTASRRPRVQVSTNNGSSFDTTASNYVYYGLEDGSMPFIGAEATLLVCANEALAASTFSGIVKLECYQGGPNAIFSSMTRPTTAPNLSIPFGTYIGSTSAINALQVLWNASGNFDAGTYALYGVA